jgi:hypothetical protein
VRTLAEKGKTRARIIKMKFGGGEEGALITNMSECGAWELKGLYRKRWGDRAEVPPVEEQAEV